MSRFDTLLQWGHLPDCQLILELGEDTIKLEASGYDYPQSEYVVKC